MSEAEQRNAAKLLEMICGNWRTQAIGVAVELRIFDFLATGPKTITELASKTQCIPDPLHRFMRALVTIELVTQKGEAFAVTELGQMLSRDAPVSLWAWGEWYAKHIWTTWGNLLYSVKTGESARKMLAGLRGYDHVAHDAEAAFVFNVAMTQMSFLVTHALLEHYQFDEAARIVDVGSGYGEVLVGILEKYPATTGVLFDLEHAIEGAKSRLANHPAKSRIEFAVGDFFQGVPGGGDYYLLKSVLHNWSNERAAVILSVIRRAIQPGAKLLCLERMISDVVTPCLEDRATARSDLNMLVGFGGRERTIDEMGGLLRKAGLQVGNVVRLTSEFTVIEGICR